MSLTINDAKQVKKIDIHAHAAQYPELYPPVNSRETFISAPQVIENYDKLGVELGVLLPIASPEGQFAPFSNEGCYQMVKQYPGRFVWFCNVDPRAVQNNPSTDLASILKFYKDLGAKGVGEITARIYADDPRTMNLFAACEKVGLPALFHIAKDDNTNYGIIDDLGLPRIEKVLKTFPNLKLIGHSQAFWSEISADNNDQVRGGFPTGKVTPGRITELMRKYPNLYCDLSAGSGSNAMMRDKDHAAKFMAEFSDRIFYGIDMCAPSNTHQFTFNDFLNEMLDEGLLSPKNYVKIVRDNAKKLLEL